MTGDVGFWARTLHDPTAFFTLWVAAFTAVLAISTIALWRETRRTAERAEGAIRAVEGAWIFAAPIISPELLSSADKLRIYVSNHGNTPGLITQYHMEFHQNPPVGNQVRYRVPIDDTKTVVIMGPKEKNWPLEHLFDWNRSDMFAVGFVTYLDAFGKTKTSRFCYNISGGQTKIAGSHAYNSFHAEES